MLALYGHPKSGRIWEDDCTRRVLDCGKHGGKWELMSDPWPNVFWKPEIKAFMLVYVDDFKLIAQKGDHNELWNELNQSSIWEKKRKSIDFWGAIILLLNARLES